MVDGIGREAELCRFWGCHLMVCFLLEGEVSIGDEEGRKICGLFD